MKMQQLQYNGQFSQSIDKNLDSKNTLCFVFFDRLMKTDELTKSLKAALPQSQIIGCSGAGEIYDATLSESSAVVTIVRFDKTQLVVHAADVGNVDESFSISQKIAKNFNSSKLKSVFILSPGLNVNGTEIMRGMRSVLSNDVIISGGLAADGTRFEQTQVLFNNRISHQQLVAVGFMGDSIKVKSNAIGGWLPFGPERTVTKAAANVLYELDGVPALQVYKQFLGKAAEGLPSSALNFPLLLGGETQSSRATVRTILAVDEKSGSMTFAGDIPEGENVRFMRATNKELIKAANDCVGKCLTDMNKSVPTLSLAVSCVGRRLVMGSEVEEEIEVIKEALTQNSVQTGFYSYGELAPGVSQVCDLHNQTITLTLMQEE